MNEKLIRLRGKYEILNDESRDLCRQVADEAKSISDWIGPFEYCGNFPEIHPKEMKDADLIINKIKRMQENYNKIAVIVKELDSIKPLLFK